MSLPRGECLSFFFPPVSFTWNFLTVWTHISQRFILVSPLSGSELGILWSRASVSTTIPNHLIFVFFCFFCEGSACRAAVYDMRYTRNIKWQTETHRQGSWKMHVRYIVICSFLNNTAPVRLKARGTSLGPFDSQPVHTESPTKLGRCQALCLLLDK